MYVGQCSRIGRVVTPLTYPFTWQINPHTISLYTRAHVSADPYMCELSVTQSVGLSIRLSDPQGDWPRGSWAWSREITKIQEQQWPLRQQLAMTAEHAKVC